jgi:hypothetical protein
VLALFLESFFEFAETVTHLCQLYVDKAAGGAVGGWGSFGAGWVGMGESEVEWGKDFVEDSGAEGVLGEFVCRRYCNDGLRVASTSTSISMDMCLKEEFGGVGLTSPSPSPE